MERSGCGEKKSKSNKKNMVGVGVGVGLKKGPWTQEEDQKLLAYIQQFGHCSWRALPAKADLKRCGKSCRLRWKNYLRPDIKREKFSLEEERTIIQLHALLGNRWSAIAAHLPKRTDSKIKNHWNSHIKKRLDKMGIDPETHKLKTNTSGSNLSHMAQWEAARLEAEARLVQKKPKHFVTPPSTHDLHKRLTTIPPCLDVLKVWEGTLRSKSINGGLLTPHSTSSFSKVVSPTIPVTPMMNYVENKGSLDQEEIAKRHDRTKTLMDWPFEEFVYPFDANFIFGDPTRSPGLWEGFVDRPINGVRDREIMYDGWTGLDECSPPASSVF